MTTNSLLNEKKLTELEIIRLKQLEKSLDRKIHDRKINEREQLIKCCPSYIQESKQFLQHNFESLLNMLGNDYFRTYMKCLRKSENSQKQITDNTESLVKKKSQIPLPVKKKLSSVSISSSNSSNHSIKLKPHSNCNIPRLSSSTKHLRKSKTTKDITLIKPYQQSYSQSQLQISKSMPKDVPKLLQEKHYINLRPSYYTQTSKLRQEASNITKAIDYNIKNCPKDLVVFKNKFAAVPNPNRKQFNHLDKYKRVSKLFNLWTNHIGRYSKTTLGCYCSKTFSINFMNSRTNELSVITSCSSISSESTHQKHVFMSKLFTGVLAILVILCYLFIKMIEWFSWNICFCNSGETKEHH